MTPSQYLALCLVLTAVSAAVQLVLRKQRARVMRHLAREWQMHYSPVDRLDLATRVVDRLGVPGASDVRVLDLLYRTDRTHHRYLFTAEYGVGVIRSKHRRRRAVAVAEPVHRGEAHLADATVAVAPEELPLLEQYRHLRATAFESPEPSPRVPDMPEGPAVPAPAAPEAPPQS